MQLPQRPVTFSAAYLLLTALMVEPTVLGLPGSLYVAWIGFAAILSWHCLWAAQLAGTGRRRAEAPSQGPDLVRTLAFVPPGLVVAGGVYGLFIQPYTPAPIAAVLDAGLVLVWICVGFSFLALLWLSAQRFCATERERSAGSHGVFLTLVLALYVFIGAPILYPRVKRLKGMG